MKRPEYACRSADLGGSAFRKVRHRLLVLGTTQSFETPMLEQDSRAWANFVDVVDEFDELPPSHNAIERNAFLLHLFLSMSTGH